MPVVLGCGFRGWQSTGTSDCSPQSTLGQLLVLSMKLFRNMARLVYLHVVCGCFCTVVGESSSHDKFLRPTKALLPEPSQEVCLLWLTGCVLAGYCFSCPASSFPFSGNRSWLSFKEPNFYTLCPCSLMSAVLLHFQEQTPWAFEVSVTVQRWALYLLWSNSGTWIEVFFVRQESFFLQVC